MEVRVPFVPQPIPNVSGMGQGTWHWILSSVRAVTFKDETCTWLLANCPHRVGTFFGDQIVQSVRPERTDAGWYWIYDLRAPENELEGFWAEEAPLLPPPPESLVCSYCGASKDVRLVEAMTAYADESLNQPNLLCGGCAEDYRSHWQDMWAEYYSGLGV